LKTSGPIVFTSATGKLDVAKAAGLNEISLVKDNGDGFSTYALNLAAKQHEAKRSTR